VTDLTLDSELEGTTYPVAFGRVGPDIWYYPVDRLQNALIAVGQSCEDPPEAYDPGEQTVAPTVEPTATPTPGPPVRTVPAGDTELGVDVITSGNAATSVGNVEDCASAEVGQTFTVDVVVKGVEDLLGFEVPISFDATRLILTGRDVEQFMQANDGSEVFDGSNQTPNTTGSYLATAVDFADPVAPDSGDGVLVRFTFEAIAEGTAQLFITPIDLDGNGIVDRGLLLRNVDEAIIGDLDEDTFFDGPVSNAEVRVGSDCAGGGEVTQDGESGGGGGDEDDSNSWLLIAAGAGVVAVVAAAGAALVLTRRRRPANVPPPGPVM
jgi:hypothetical protein